MNYFLKCIVDAKDYQWTGFIVIVSILSAIVMLTIAITADHSIRCYYPNAEATSSGVAYKIMSDIDWSVDKPAFMFDNADKAIDVLKSLNQCAVK